jgi:hypothetical protein
VSLFPLPDGAQDDLQRTNREVEALKVKVKGNELRIKLNKQLPYLVANIVEVGNRPCLCSSAIASVIFLLGS